MLRETLLWASRNPWLSQRLPRYRFVQRAVRRFMPGEDMAAAIAETVALNQRGIGTVLTLLGENITTEAESEAVACHYREVVGQVKQRGLDAEISVKLTQLGLDLSPEVAFRHLRALAEAAAAKGDFLWVDMEASEYTDVTLDLYRRLHAEHPRTGLCLQAYLLRTVDDLDSLLALGASIRLVKGAYAEPKRIAFPKKADVDANYFRLAQRMLRAEAKRRAFATHDRRLIERLRAEARAIGVGRDAYEFQMLYGIAREEQRRLVEEGERLRVLISYGSAWFPWYMRRLAERPANLWFVVKSSLAVRVS
jgi:proline dehydrogenase